MDLKTRQPIDDASHRVGTPSTAASSGDRVTSDIGPFAMLPQWILHADISDRAVRLFAILARHADRDTGEAYPSRRTLAQTLKVSRDSVDRALKELVSIGAVEVEPRLDAFGDWTTNLYRLRFVQPVAATMRPPISTDAETGSRTPAETVAAPMRHRTKATGTKDKTVQEKTREEGDASPLAPSSLGTCNRCGDVGPIGARCTDCGCGIHTQDHLIEEHGVPGSSRTETRLNHTAVSPAAAHGPLEVTT